MTTLPKTYDGKQAAVIGAGASGRAAARLLRALGARVRVLDQHMDRVDEVFTEWALAAGIKLVGGEHQPEHFVDVDLVIPSPGVNPVSFERMLSEPRPEVLSEMELAWKHVYQPVVAITGTNGKTTTAMLTAHILEHIGRKVFLGGNIGTPLSEYVLAGERADVLVLEISSFQLMTCREFRPWVGVLLNISPNHLNYHADMDEYVAAKLKLFAKQEPEDLAVLPAAQREFLETRPELAAVQSRKVWYEARRRLYSENMPGEHNQGNIEAAYQACRFFGVTENEAQTALRSFRVPPHRLEPVGEVGGVRFVNDSKATTIEAMRAAIRSQDKPVLLLAGGVFKGGDLASLLPDIREHVRLIGLFGASREEFESAFAGQVELFWEPNLEAATRRLFAQAKRSEVILLSPGTASFDLYSDYKARGKDFQRIVEELA